MKNKLLLLIANNIKYDLRSWKCLLLEILIIAAAFLALSVCPSGVILNTNLNTNDLERTQLNENDVEIKELKLFRQIMNIPPQSQSYGLLYTPIHETTRAIMNEVLEILSLDDVQGVDDEFERLLQKSNKNETLAAVIFHKFSRNVLSITIRFPNQFRTLRKDTECWERACFWSTRFSGSLEGDVSDESVDLYIREGFLQVQHAIFLAWIQFYDSPKYHEIPSVVVNSFLQESDQHLYLLRGRINFVWVFYYILYFVPFLNLVWKIAREVEECIPAHHFIYGISYNKNWIAHVIASYLHFFLLDVLIFIFLKIEWPYGAISNIKSIYLLLFLILYTGMLILNALILATLLGNAKDAVLLTASLWWAAYGVLSITLANAATIGPPELVWLLMFLNNFFPFGMTYLEDHSEEKIPKQIWFLLLTQTCSILFYWCCLQCLDCLRPGRDVRKSNDEGCFCKCNKNEQKLVTSENNTTFYNVYDDTKWSTFEYGPIQGHMLTLQNLYVYRDRQKRECLLKNISMRLFKDEISVVLGPHSSGKTTLISVLAGWHRYYGHIYYEENMEISENLSYYYRHIDVSMARNPLYDLLTVEEQLKYTLSNKLHEFGHSRTQLKMEVDKWLMLLKTSIADSSLLVHTLNFGQKRLLALCGTLCGYSRVILLDEPTLHMRAEERSAYWRILKQEKLNRVIVMTTNSIDEANEIADRVAILNHGSLMAWGTPFYLKHNLCKDIYLVLFVASQAPIELITQLLQKYIPSIAAHSQFNDRVIYLLPHYKQSSFQRILIELEKESNQLGISNMYMTGYELNDVYMDVAARPEIRKRMPERMEKTLTFLNEPKPQHREVSKTSALFYKKLLYQAPNVTPVFIMFLAFLLILMINEMSKHFTSYYRIQMGFSPYRDTNEVDVVDMTTCKYLEINRIDEMRRSKTNWRSQKWFINKLKCGNVSYKKDLLKDRTVGVKLGAIERDLGKSQIQLWINEKIFHSGALSLNLAHNVILKILIELEKESNQLGISNMYMTGYELNDVYMDVAARPEIRKRMPERMEKTLTFLNEPKPQHREVSKTSALFYKKLLYQAPNVTPVFIMFLAFLLILMINEMSKHFTSYYRIQMGFSPYRDTNEVDVVDMTTCKYLEINRIDEMRRSKTNWRSQKWFINKLKCGNVSYKKDLLKDRTVGVKLGAIERDLGKSQIQLWINEKIFHSGALSLNLAHNVILNDLYPNNTIKMVNINNEPIWEPTSEKIALNHFTNLYVPLTLGIIMPLTISVFIVTLIDERRNHMQTLQRISGVTTTIFWLTTFIWDYAVYVVLTLLYFLMMSTYTIDEFLGISKLVTLLLLSVYGIASLMLVYLVFLFVGDHKFAGFLKLFLLQIIVGYCPFIVYWEVADTDPYWLYVMMFSPTFALLVGMANVQAENRVRVFCQDRCGDIFGCNEENDCSFVPQCCSKTFLQWSYPGILPSLFFMLLTALILTIIFISVIVYRSKKKYSLPNRIRQMTSVCYPYDDELVTAEKIRISKMNIATCTTHAVLVDQLEYEIPKWGNRVKTMSFALNRYGCLGIYGSAHSGKTHLIKQLIGEEGYRFGEVYICGREIKHGLRKAIRNLGYCPQVHKGGLCEGSTPRQLFTLFFLLSGISEANCYNNISDLSLTFNLRNYMNTRISEVPAHIQRRINIAITLIFHNKVLIFDEPTAGLAGHERHLIWHVMRLARANGNAIIFSSQDTVELEQLADFIIMVDDGEILAIGSPQSIRQRYTMGFYLEIKLKSDGDTLEEMENNLRKDIENLQRFIAFLHAESELLNRHGNVLKYYLPIESVTYSYVFGTMEKNRQRLNITEYMISQGSLSTALDNLRKARKEKVRYEKLKTSSVLESAPVGN